MKLPGAHPRPAGLSTPWLCFPSAVPPTSIALTEVHSGDMAETLGQAVFQYLWSSMDSWPHPPNPHMRPSRLHSSGPITTGQREG